MPDDFADSTLPVAFISGATGGLGQAFSRELAAQGYRLILLGRDKERLQALAASLAVPCMTQALDFSEAQSIRALQRYFNEMHICVDVLINNAGWGLLQAFDKTPIRDIEDMIRVDVNTLSALCALCVPSMKEREKGAILNVASIAGFMPCPYFAVYSAAKAYVLSFSEALHEELKPQGIAVTALCPGPIDTAFWHRAGLTSCSRFDWTMVSAERVVREGLNALSDNRAVCVPGWLNKLLVVSAQIAPRPLVRLIAREVMQWAGKN